MGWFRRERVSPGYYTKRYHFAFKQLATVCWHPMRECSTMRSISLSMTTAGGGTTLICRKCRGRTAIVVESPM